MEPNHNDSAAEQIYRTTDWFTRQLADTRKNSLIMFDTFELQIGLVLLDL